MEQALGCLKVRKSTVAVVEELGIFDKVHGPGWHCVPWCFGKMKAGEISLREQAKKVRVESTTRDHISVTVVVRVAYRVVVKDADSAFYNQSDINSKIQSRSYDVIRATVATLDMTSVFLQKNEIAQALDAEIKSATLDLGIEIVCTCIMSIEIDKSVKTRY